MVSPELLRRFRFFAGLTEDQLKEIAMIADELEFMKGDLIFSECELAEGLFILQHGSVDLFYRSEEEFHPTISKEFHIGTINPGEMFGVSALIEPNELNATARAAQDSTSIKIDAQKIQKMVDDNADLGYKLITQTSKVLMERLGATRVQLAAAWVD
jgi:CRP/FNR family cyclic AMP-dependent transcriptional regulator